MKLKNHKTSKRAATIIAAALLVISVCVGAIAYQTSYTDDTVNEIASKKLNASISEELDENTKKEITVVADSDNTGDVYVRVALVAYWTSYDDEDIIYTDEVPDLSQYINTDDWTATEVSVISSGGTATGFTNTYYVYNEPLAPGEETSNLLKESITMESDGEKKLEITVLMQAADKETFEGSVMQ